MIDQSIIAAHSQEIRYVVGFLAVVVLAYWTLERVWGEGDDPTIRLSSSSDTGSMSFLVSGVRAVALVAGFGAIALGQLGIGVIAPLGTVVLAHWIVEKEERE